MRVHVCEQCHVLQPAPCFTNALEEALSCPQSIHVKDCNQQSSLLCLPMQDYLATILACSTLAHIIDKAKLSQATTMQLLKTRQFVRRQSKKVCSLSVGAAVYTSREALS